MNRRPGSRGVTLLELLVILAAVVLAAAIVVPLLLAERLHANEAAAIETMKFIADAQERFKASGKVDLDQDGAGEYGYLKEMSAASGVRAAPDGSKIGEAALPSALPREFEALDPGGEFVRAGYRFRVFLPDARGDGVGETERFPLDRLVDAKLAASTWCCYAWPAHHGTTGDRTFFVNQDGRVVSTDCDAYSGPGRFRTDDCGAAFGRGGPPTSITGAVAVGTRGRDGNVWRRAF